MRYLGLIVLALFFPLVTPLIVNLYIDWVPDSTVDGWLGYWGGYWGGIVAFASAYVLFMSERRLSSQSWLKAKLVSAPDINDIEYSLIYTPVENLKTFNWKVRRVIDWESYPVVTVSIKNVSSNYAKSIEIILVNNPFKKLRPFVHRINEVGIAKHEKEAELGQEEEFIFVIHIDPKYLRKNGPVKFYINSTSSSNAKNSQKFELHQSTISAAMTLSAI